MDDRPPPDDVKRLLAKRGLRTFLEVVTIACRPTPSPFGSVADPWQWEKVLNPMIPAIEATAGVRTDKGPFDIFWITLPKGSDKTSCIARCGHWICNYGKKKAGMIVWASDKKQAKLLRDAMKDEQELNPWFPKDYIIDNYMATGATGFVEINSSDAAGGHGTRGHIYVVDELPHWGKKSVWNMVRSSATKYQENILIVLGNAGYKDTWQYKLRQAMESRHAAGERTYFWEPWGLQASWANRKMIESARRDIDPNEGQRLYDNIWVEGGADAAWPANLINEMFSLTDPYPVILPRIGD